MKLYQMSVVKQGNVQVMEFVAANTINDAIEFIQSEDFEIPGFNPNMVQEIGNLHIAPAGHIEAKIVRFESDD